MRNSLWIFTTITSGLCGFAIGLTYERGNRVMISPEQRSEQKVGQLHQERTPLGLIAALDLLWMAESNYGRSMVGDGGKAHGHFQQHKEHWAAGTNMLGVDWAYSDTLNLARSAAVVAANWAIYAKQALAEGDVEELIARHRLPNNPWRKDNQKYTSRVLGANQ